MKKENNNRISSFVVILFVIVLYSSCGKKNNTTPVVAITPSVTTSAISAITTTTATSGGNVTSDGGASVTVRGVCWATSANPTTSNSKTANGTSTGTFTSSLTGLTSATTYYVRAYATNSAGTAYGNQVSFTSATSPGEVSLDSVIIGSQVWTLKNLDVTTYSNGDAIPQVIDPTQWAGLITGAWCYYNNDSANNAVYGKLYNWYAVNDSRGLAPSGWHIPSDAEWTTLSTFLGGDSVAGGKMKETGTTHWKSPNVGATNSSGFTGLPGSYRGWEGSWVITLGQEGHWWSSSKDNTNPNNQAWHRDIENGYGALGGSSTVSGSESVSVLVGYSVRCVKD